LRADGEADEIAGDALHQAMLRRLPRRIAATGRILLPAAPSLTDHYTELLQTTFAELGRVFAQAETAHLRDLVRRRLAEGFALSPHARIAVDYRTEEPPDLSIAYRITLEVTTTADAYAHWVETRPAPLFGKHPDAKVMSAARSLGPPRDVCVLDIGAGTGRNALPLARAGFRVDAIEPAPALADILTADLEREGLEARVLQGDALTDELEVPAAHYQLVVLSGVVASHLRGTAQCRTLFERAALVLAQGGLLVFNAFLAREGYTPDAISRELSQVFWCSLFTRGELAGALHGLPFERVSDEPAVELERSAMSPEEWPPTPWFEAWSEGRDLFDLPRDDAPMELRWVVYRRV